jgi:hypothetical protein
MTKDFINTRKKFEKLDVNDIKNCIATEDYDELLKFMGNNSKIVLNARINASGIGLHLGKPVYYISVRHPFLKFRRLGFPPGIIQQWIIYAKYTNENASVYVEPESGDPFYINGSNSILVGIWIIPPINRIKYWTRMLALFEINITLPWSLEKWISMPFIPWAQSRSIFGIPIPTGVIEGLIMFIFWPFRIKTSFIGLFKPIQMWGMTPFVIYTTS